MAFEQMSESDQQVIGECLRTALLFIDDDLDTLTGVEWDELERIAAAYPNISDDDETISLAIHGSLLNLVFYPHGRERNWADHISIPREDIPGLHVRWMKLKGWDIPSADSPGELYFKLMR